jgi:tubulin polyglutamylase TTLL6/13
LKEENNEMSFELFGFDIFLDENMKPWLLEVNHTPSFTTDTPLDYHIKKSLILDTLIMQNVT